MSLRHIILVFITLSAVVACNKNSSIAQKTQSGSLTLKGAITDSQLSNATICLDCNGSVLCEDNEPVTYTDSKSEFSLINLTQNQLNNCPLLAEITKQTMNEATQSFIQKPYLLRALPKSNKLNIFSTFTAYKAEFEHNNGKAKQIINKLMGSSLSFNNNLINSLNTVETSSHTFKESMHMMQVSSIATEMLAHNTHELSELLGLEHNKHKEIQFLIIDKLLSGINVMHSELHTINQNNELTPDDVLNFFERHKESLPGTIQQMSVINRNDLSTSSNNAQNLPSLESTQMEMREVVNQQISLMSRKLNASPLNLFDAYHSTETQKQNIFHPRADDISVFGVRASFIGQDVIDSEAESFTIRNYKRKHSIGEFSPKEFINSIFGNENFSGKKAYVDGEFQNINSTYTVQQFPTGDFVLTNQGAQANKVNVSGGKYSLESLNAKMVLTENDTNRNLSHWRNAFGQSETFVSDSSAYNLTLSSSGEQFLFSRLRDCNQSRYYFSGCNQVVKPNVHNHFNRTANSIQNDIINDSVNDGMVVKRNRLNSLDSEDYYLKFFIHSDGQHGMQLLRVDANSNPHRLEQIIEEQRWWQVQRTDSGHTVMTITIPPQFRRNHANLLRDFPDNIALIGWGNKVYWGRHYRDGQVINHDIFTLDHSAMSEAFYHVSPDRRGLPLDY
ncbi:hypothetical protein D5R81_19570 [Parashewanella spongiae]|uniref:Uncharacterized protein n=1 Tax=Parashewanella spongiae TaxID=342950 RepID=A0A3A6TP06_9GAMM|nr:hypothetical protein [Parashewanella spongiae]MCL1080220.1 hypothetical protein [Parashewanella spongiae]RJY02112.1 hypothetical protein D5R81_19570 [Parashewanella spongiae]